MDKIKSMLAKKPTLFKALIGVVAFVLVGLVVVYVYVIRPAPEVELYAAANSPHAVTTPYHTDPIPTEPIPTPIMVQVTGEVYAPGFFELYYGDRVWQAIEAAGGLTDDADISAINQTLFLYDTQHIFVHSIEDNMPPATGASPQGGDAAASNFPVNINTATVVQLQTLSGIGEARARDIINHRTARGGFDTIYDIMNVPGIAEGIFARIRDQITVN